MRTMEDVQLEVMKVLDTYTTPLEDKAKLAYEILLNIFNTESTDGRRLKQQKDLIYMLMFYTMRMANVNDETLVNVGKLISRIEGRSAAYHHTSVLHGIKQHITRVQSGRRAGWGEYNDRFNEFCRRVCNVSSVINPELDAISTNKFIYGYLRNS